jgi:hypothetical protein
VTRDGDGVIENTLLWAAVSSEEEAQYLTAIIKSSTVKRLIERRQSTGQWGARHVTKLIFDLGVASFDPRNRTHAGLARMGKGAEKIASSVIVEDSTYFVSARQRVRAALDADGVAAAIDEAVEGLLGPSSPRSGITATFD